MKSSRPTRSPGLRLAADIGGTFTDVAAFDARTGRLTFGKALSTSELDALMDAQAYDLISK